MTKEQKAAYLKGGAHKCPYCGSNKLDCDRLILVDHEDEYECRTRCTACGREWTDVYRVVDVRGDGQEVG